MSNCCLRGGGIAFLKYAPSQSSRCMATSVKVGGQLAKVAHLTLTSSNIFDDLLSARNPSHSAILDPSARFCRRETGAPICNGLLKRRNGIAAVSNLQRTFSTTTKPFSRKKPAPKAPEIDASTGDIICEPLLSFNYQATLGIIQIARAVAPIVSMNEGFILTANYDLRTDAFDLAGEKEPLCLELKTNGKGSYLFTIDRPTERINLVSPMSGAHSYFFDQEEQLWLSMNTDRHDLRGMVTRDLLRHARGLCVF